MIDIKEINVSAEYGIDKLVVTFKTSDCVIDLSRYRFDIYRSDSDIGSYTIVAYDVTSDTFVDKTVNLMNQTKHYYYKVLVTDKTENISVMSDVTGFTELHKPDIWGSAIIDIESLWLENTIDNDEVMLLKRRTGGQLCDCYDTIRKISQPDCPKCFGTRYVGGFYPAQKIMVNYHNSITTSENFDQRGVVDGVTPINFWTKNLPRIFPNDIIVGQNDARYIVNSSNITYKNHYVIRQIILATPIPKSDRRYKIPLVGGMVNYEP